MLRKRALVFLLLSVVLLVLLPATAAAAPVPTDPAVLKALAAARAATARYHDVANALADGYVPFGLCVEVPGLGGMGIHYVNLGLAFDPEVNELQPEILLYVPTQAGPRLVGVEYFMAAIGTSALLGYTGPWSPVPNPFGLPSGPLPGDWVWLLSAPSVFGQTLMGDPAGGPMIHEGEPVPWHYELHVWLWQANPAGIFAEFNPNVSCD